MFTFSNLASVLVIVYLLQVYKVTLLLIITKGSVNDFVFRVMIRTQTGDLVGKRVTLQPAETLSPMTPLFAQV